MSYEKQTWNNGDVITADKLNHMEDGIDTAGAADKGYEYTESTIVLYEGELTTSEVQGLGVVALFSEDEIDVGSITVEFDGTTYILPKNNNGYILIYGEMSNNMPVFSQYPCAVLSVPSGGSFLATPQAGTHLVKIIGTVVTVEVNTGFEKAVETVVKTAVHPLVNIADGENYSIVEGAVGQNTATGRFAHAEGTTTTASGNSSHAEGTATTASGMTSHAQNSNTIAQGYAQTVIGQYNIAQGSSAFSTSTDYALIVGNGTSNNRRNAFAMKWDGTFVFADGTEITPAQFAQLKALLS